MKKVVFLVSMYFLLSCQNDSSFQEKHFNIALRNIGHELLLKSGDSSSAVLPIKKIAQNLHQIEFQSELVFAHDTLVELFRKNLKISELPSNYIVSVLNCGTNKIVFGYEINLKTKNTIPCTGRKQAKGCYVIQIEFLEEKRNFLPYLWLLILPIIALYFLRNQILGIRKMEIIDENDDFEKIGIFEYLPEKSALKSPTEIIELTENENKLLQILWKNQNQLIDREQLLKEIWEDQGSIVVSRSLDVLVSKLRKKIKDDPSIKISNIHGKGYKIAMD